MHTDGHQLFAEDDFATLAENGAQVATGNVLDNDSGVDIVGALSVGGTLFAAYGTIELGADGNYTYTLDHSAVQFLAEGEELVDFISYTLEDEGGATDDATLQITIVGANDAPQAVAASGVLLEPDPGAVETTAGQMLFSDPELLDTHTTSFAPRAAGYLGEFDALLVQDSQFGAQGVIDWTFSVDAGLIDHLAEGQTLRQVYDVSIDDGNGGIATQAVTIDIVGTNDAPVVANPIADQAADAGRPFAFTVAANTFSDVDRRDTLRYSATLADGSALPSWLSFNATTRTFAGTPPLGPAATLQLRVTATDSSNAIAFDDFTVNIAGGGDDAGRLIIGTAKNDVLTGSAFDDVIDGREGVDRMAGGRGNDLYFVERKADRVIEQSNEGYDVVYAGVDYTLAENVEEARLLGCEDLNATGNSFDNVLVGNEGDNVLSGGSGADTYVYSLREGADVIDEKGTADQVDTLQLQGVSASSVRVNRKHNDLVVDFPGRDGKVTIRNWFSSSASRVERFQFDDGTVWDEAKIRSRVGKSVALVPDHSSHHWDHDPGRSHGKGGQHDGRHHDDRHRDRRRDSDERILRRLKQPVSFSFEEITEALGEARPTLSAEQIAQRWATVRGYFCDGGHCGEDHDGAVFPSLRDLGLTSGGGNHCGFGFEGSTGSRHGQGEMECLRGLLDGFRKL